MIFSVEQMTRGFRVLSAPKGEQINKGLGNVLDTQLSLKLTSKRWYYGWKEWCHAIWSSGNEILGSFACQKLVRMLGFAQTVQKERQVMFVVERIQFDLNRKEKSMTAVST